MKLDEIVAWYQKKIGTYDKQEWEKTVEQRILDGFNNVNLKNTKLKTELIDVDLVRGSTFPKAKPKQSLLTVIRLAILRYVLLPLYAQWWVKQTSPNAFGFILVLYLTQLVNWAIYVLHSNSHTEQLAYDKPLNGTLLQAGTAGEDADKQEEHADLLSALLIPCALSLLISLIHSQIVATNTATGGTGGSSTKNKLRRFSMTSTIGDKSSVREHRLRRRKKFVSRPRQPEVEPNSSNISIPARRNATSSGLEVLSRPVSQPPTTVASGVVQSDPILAATPSRPVVVKRSSSEETYITTTAISALHLPQATPSADGKPKGFDLSRQTGGPTAATPESPKKRNVNWHTPIQIYATYERTEQPSSSQTGREEQDEAIVDEEIRALKPSYQSRRNIGEDDGFESLNGKSSSGEDNNHSPLPNVTASTVTAPVPVQSNQLRLRLNTGNSSSNNSAPPVEKLTQSRGNESTTSCAESDECDEADIISSPASTCNQECTTSATDWLGVTTNSEDCSYTSDLDHSDGGYKHAACSDEDPGELDITPTTILNPHSSLDRISCTIWDQRDAKKAQLSVLEIASCIIERVDSMGETNDYIYIGVVFSFLLTLIPIFCRLCEITLGSDAEKASEISYLYMPQLLWEKSSASLFNLLGFAFGEAQWERTVLALGFVQRLCLTLILFTIFAVAERTFKQRFLYAKLFSHLTSSRRARKSNLPHFRLNKVRNIKTWLSVRSYLKKRGPQRSVDIIVSAAFIVTLLLLAFLSVEWLKDSVHLHTHLTMEALIWSITIGIYLLRFMTLGQKIQHKYRSVSVLITEQINLYLQIEQKPKKKEELMVSNSVLKLAADLLKELETPFKISGLSANPYLFTTIKIYATYERTEQPSSSQSGREEQDEAIVDEEIRALKPSYQSRRNIGEDDGFESLNGKSSSGEDNNHSPLPNVTASTVTAPVPVQSNQLRLRLNTGNSSSNISAPPAEKLSQSRGNESTTSCAESDECDEADIISSPASTCNQECTTSATDWLGVTTNSEDCSYTSDLDHSDGGYKHAACSDEDPGELDITPTTILNPHSSLDRISCTIWDQRDAKKAQLSVLEIASCIIERVDSMGETNDYIYIGVVFSFLLTLIPIFCRLCEITLGSDAEKASEISYLYMPQLLWEKSSASLFNLLGFAFGEAQWERTVLALGFVQRLCLTLILFTIFAVAERTFKQRFLYAKLFSHLTSSRRARKSNLPHFRLNKVRNIKTWLSVRSYLKKRGPQRSVDIIVSAAFIVTLLLLAFLSVEWLKDSVHLHTHLTMEALIWSITIGIYLLRFMTLGQKIQHKYRSVSVLITEQINLYLQIEQKPKKKEELMVSNSVLKLAADLLKELETPFKISGLSANPYLFTTIKVVILSALWGVLSEVLGFKLKLHKIKIK